MTTGDRSTNQCYDLIVVGAGSAGCVVAARLSEDPRRKVLLLEAGPDYSDVRSLPREIANVYHPAFTYDWGYSSEPGSPARSVPLPRAKLVGGCSATNAAFALRGAPEDYDAWARMGNPGWSFEELLPYFRRLENDHDFQDSWHGKKGPVPIRRYGRDELTPVQRAFLSACARAGYPTTADHNAPQALGVGATPMNRTGALRESTALAYLAPARARPNLTIHAGAVVDRVVIEGDKAVGVRLARSEEKILGNHVVISAGTYGSPAILLRSGIGPARDLRSLGIDVVTDLPGVGESLMDHPLLFPHFTATIPYPSEDLPYAQVMLRHGDYMIAPTSVYPPQEPWNTPTFYMIVALVKPRSRGRLRLRSSDAETPPVIDLGYFRNQEDLPRMIEALRLALGLAATSPLDELIGTQLFPGEKRLEQAVREGVDTFHHPVGTCRMGPDGDAMSVVNHRGEVHRIKSLSVIDASIMPAIPSVPTNIPTIMIAERCSEWLSEVA